MLNGDLSLCFCTSDEIQWNVLNLTEAEKQINYSPHAALSMSKVKTFGDHGDSKSCTDT